MEWAWWLGVAIALGIIEIFTTDVLILMLIGGALSGAAAAALGAPVAIQILVACAVSVLLVVLLRPWVLEQLRKRVPLQETNIKSLLGKTGVVVSEVTHGSGRIKLAGEVWTARLDDVVVGPLTVGQEVTMSRIDGVTAVVVPAKTAND